MSYYFFIEREWFQNWEQVIAMVAVMNTEYQFKTCK